MSRLHFKWLKDGLVAANTGKPFTVGGLEAVCSSHRSDKKDALPRLFESENDARQKVADVRKNRLEAYHRCPGDIVEHARAEKEMGLDYSNRLLLELMQNADDAAALVAIGYKGLGFKAVLDISESVQIRSGHMQVRFDLEESRRALLEAGLPAGSEVPVLRLPFSDDNSMPALEPEVSYDAVVFLPWKTANDRRELFSQEWERTCADPTVLLFLHALEEVVWYPLEGEPVKWTCKRDAGTVHLSLQIGNGEPERSRWRIFRHEGRSAAAVPVDSDEQPLPYSAKQNRIRVFFPTEEHSPVPMILHGDFDLEQNRKHVRPGGNRQLVVRSLANCVRAVLSPVREDGRFLDLLTTRTGATGLEQEIWQAIQDEVRTVILPQSGVQVSAVRLCPLASEDEFPWNISTRLPNWKAFKNVLLQHRPGGISGLAVLGPDTDTSSREEVIRSFSSTPNYRMDELRGIALFSVQGSSDAIAANTCSLFFPPDNGEPQAAPEGLSIAFLAKDFAAACEDHSHLRRLLESLGVRTFRPAAIAEVLSKQPIETIDPQALWAYLLAVIAPLLRDSDAVMDWRDSSQANLTYRIKVLCREGTWVSAGSVYAGREWTGDEFIENAYATRNDRHFLVPPPSDPLLRERTERLARWLGVGWGPKVLPLVNFAAKASTREGIRWNFNVFPLSPQPELWREHWTDYDDNYENTSRSARLRRDWTLDGDATVLRVDGAFDCIVREWRTYHTYLDAVIYRSSNMREDYDNDSFRRDSYLSYLLKHVAWIPVEGHSSLQSACDTFQEGGEVRHNLAGWVFSPAGEISDVIQKGIGIRASWRELNAKDWNRWLTRAAGLNPQQEASVRGSISKLYAQILLRISWAFCWYGSIWSIQKRSDNTEEWQSETSRQSVFYVDRPDLARLRLQGIKTFPVELGWSGNRQKVSEMFAVPALSDHLRGEARYRSASATDELTWRISDRLLVRATALAAYLSVKGKDALPAVQKWQELAFHVGPELSVSFLLDGKPLEFQSRSTFFQPKSPDSAPALWFDLSENFTDKGQPKDIVWEEVGAALCYTAGLALEDGAVFAALLGCGEDSLRRKLLNLGVTQADVEAAVTKAPNAQPGGAGAASVSPEASTGSHVLPTDAPEAEHAGAQQEPASTLDDIAPDGELIDRLRRASKQLANESPQQVETTVTRTIQNDTEMIKGLKELCEFRCQFPGCGKRIQKKEGGFYIEVAHVKARAKGGTSVLGNLVVLCPNHHKEFDYGELEIIEQSEGVLYGKLNGVEFRIVLPKSLQRPIGLDT